MLLESIIDDLVDNLVKKQMAKPEDDISEITSKLSSLESTYKSILESLTSYEAAGAVNFINKKIEQKKLESYALIQRYGLGINQRNIAITNEDSYSQSDYNDFIDDTLDKGKEVSIAIALYGAAKEQITKIASKKR